MYDMCICACVYSVVWYVFNMCVCLCVCVFNMCVCVCVCVCVKGIYNEYGPRIQFTSVLVCIKTYVLYVKHTLK